MEHILIILVFIALFIGLLAYLVHKAYTIGLDAGVRIGYGGAVQDFMQQVQAEQQQQLYEQHQQLGKESQNETKARAIGFSTTQKDSEEADNSHKGD